MNRYERYQESKKIGSGSGVPIETLEPGTWFRYDRASHPNADVREFCIRYYDKMLKRYILRARHGSDGLEYPGAKVVLV